MRAANPASAMSTCKEGLARFPDDANLLCLAARAAIALRELGTARANIERAVSVQPQFSIAHETLADLLLVEGDPENAIRAYERAIELDPGRTDAHTKIARARALFEAPQPGTGKRRKKMPFAEEIANAAQLERNGEPGQAENIYRDILRQDPDHVEAMRLLATVAAKHHKYADAEVFLQRAVSRAPDYARAWLDLSTVQVEQDKLAEAITSAEKVVELTPEIAESYIALGNAHARADSAEDAIAAYEKALEISPSHPGAFSGLGHQLKTVGRQQEAIAIHRRNIEQNPRNAEPYWGLANMKTFRFERSEIATMEELLTDEDLDDLSYVQLCNALGFDYEAREEFDLAFEYFQRCNERRRNSEVYDPVETEALTERQIEVFTPEFLTTHEGNGNPDPAPIFIVGLPRSGSTLIEQILASHSQVEGTHELSDLPWVVRSAAQDHNARSAEQSRFPDFLLGLNARGFEKLGSHYLERTRKFRQGAPRFIDKNPNNFSYVGLLHLILPNAKIINARRHPMDCCFGTYKQLFASGQPFSYDLTEIGEYYLQYDRLMHHWHEVLPGNVLDVDYENVVADLETEVRRLLEYCELPFETACLNFHETDRAVKTASSEQVRQPIYDSSVNLWQNYAGHLEELLEVLEPVLKSPSKL